MTEWHVCCSTLDPILQALRGYSVKIVLEQNGFAVTQLTQSPCVFRVQHHSPYALTLLMLRDQLPRNITVKEIVK